MLKKMRRRVILAAMLAFFAVILLVAVLVNAVNYAVITNRADQTLSFILASEERKTDGSAEGSPPPGPFMALPDLEANYMTRFFVVRLDAEGNVLYVSTDYIASVDGSDAVLYAGQAMKNRADHGYIKEYRYVKEEIEDTTVLIFLNITREQQYMRSLRILTVAVSCGSLLLVFVLVALLSGKAIKPKITVKYGKKAFHKALLKM